MVEEAVEELEREGLLGLTGDAAAEVEGEEGELSLEEEVPILRCLKSLEVDRLTARERKRERISQRESSKEGRRASCRCYDEGGIPFPPRPRSRGRLRRFVSQHTSILSLASGSRTTANETYLIPPSSFFSFFSSFPASANAAPPPILTSSPFAPLPSTTRLVRLDRSVFGVVEFFSFFSFSFSASAAGLMSGFLSLPGGWFSCTTRLGSRRTWLAEDWRKRGMVDVSGSSRRASLTQSKWGGFSHVLCIPSAS
jgi:hypothetical protein